jgi:hypothetical protein
LARELLGEHGSIVRGEDVSLGEDFGSVFAVDGAAGSLSEGWRWGMVGRDHVGLR